jgi:hypothetical protein
LWKTCLSNVLEENAPRLTKEFKIDLGESGQYWSHMGLKQKNNDNSHFDVRAGCQWKVPVAVSGPNARLQHFNPSVLFNLGRRATDQKGVR